MVRSGVVDNPAKWPFCGFSEMMGTGNSISVINKKCLLDSTGIDSWDNFITLYKNQIEESISTGLLAREERWTRSIAVGDRSFVEQIKSQLAGRARSRKVSKESDAADQEIWSLRESPSSYGYESIFYYDPGMDNSIFWDEGFDNEN
jgi:putative transposase